MKLDEKERVASDETVLQISIGDNRHHGNLCDGAENLYVQ